MQQFFHCPDLLIHFLLLSKKCILPDFSLIDKILQKFKTTLQFSFEFHFFQLCKFPGSGSFRLLKLYSVQILGDTAAHLIIFLISVPCRILKFLLHLLIKPCVKNLPEDLPTLHSSRKKKFLEIPLCDHGNLGKLFIVKPKKFLNRSGYISCLCHRLAFIWIGQLRFCFSERQPCTSFLGGHIFRAPENLIFFSLVGKLKLHKRLRGSIRIFAAKHG